MIRRTEIVFAIRTDAADGDKLADSLALALGCSFTDGEFREVSALVAEALGVTIFLSPFRGIGGKRIFRLHGENDEGRFLDVPAGEELKIERIDISAYVVDLLNIRTPFHWYVPNAADLDAENEHARAIDRAWGHGAP